MITLREKGWYNPMDAPTIENMKLHGRDVREHINLLIQDIIEEGKVHPEERIPYGIVLIKIEQRLGKWEK